jgi:molecular chaperone DnaK
MNKLETLLVGIDFGTTNTVVSYFDNNKIKILMDKSYKTIPSKIGFYNNKYYCGNYIPLHCDNIIHSFKNNLDNIEHLIIFFSHIYELIVNKLNNSTILAVITTPSNFNDTQREIIKSAFEHVKINVLRIINEPSAAALAYGLNTSANICDKILVIDTGGGTMDFTILDKTEDLFQVIHSEGINDLGGNNFTNVIVDDIKKNINIDTNIWNKAEHIKHKLAYLDNYKTIINNEEYTITRKKFNNLSNSLLNRVELILDNICKDYEFNNIIMVGGSSRLLSLQHIIKQKTKKEIWLHPNLETVVAEGAGLYASIIENKYKENEDVILLDVVPLSLGIELDDGTFSVIIPKNTPLPVKRTQKYTTSLNNITVKVYQGERTVADKNTLIGTFNFDKILLVGVPVIDITIKIDLNGIINISIIDKKSGVSKSIVIKDLPKLDSNYINEIISNASKLAETDSVESIRKHNIYLINNYIENALMNLSINTLIDNNEKDIMIERFHNIENNIDNTSNTKLLEIVSELETTYKILINENFNTVDSSENICSIDCADLKKELECKVKILLHKNPEFKEILEPIIEELSYNNTTLQYINDKLSLINELENKTDKDYKSELYNLCIFLKNEILLGNIMLEDNHNKTLIQMINTNLDLIHNSDNQDPQIWADKLDNLNEFCELL